MKQGFSNMAQKQIANWYTEEPLHFQEWENTKEQIKFEGNADTVGEIRQSWGKRVRKKKLDKWQNDSWILYQDNEPVDNALSVKLCCEKMSDPILDHSPCLLEFLPWDCIPFSNVNSALKGTHYRCVEEAKPKTAKMLKTVKMETQIQWCKDRKVGWLG